MFGPTDLFVNTWKKTLAHGLSEASLALRSAPGAGVIPLHRLGFGMSMLLDPRASTLLDVLGDDAEAQAETIAWFISRCTDEELEQLQGTFVGAILRRSV